MAKKKQTADILRDWRTRELLRPEEVAAILGESRSGIYSRIYRGQIPVVRFGKSVRVPTVKFAAIIDGLIAGSLIVGSRPTA